MITASYDSMANAPLAKRSELLHQTQIILVDPDLRDLAAREDEDVEALVLDPVPRRGHPQERPVVGPLDEPARRRLVTLRDQPLHGEFDVREPGAQPRHEAAHPVPP